MVGRWSARPATARRRCAAAGRCGGLAARPAVGVFVRGSAYAVATEHPRPAGLALPAPPCRPRPGPARPSLPAPSWSGLAPCDRCAPLPCGLAPCGPAPAGPVRPGRAGSVRPGRVWSGPRGPCGLVPVGAVRSGSMRSCAARSQPVLCSWGPVRPRLRRPRLRRPRVVRSRAAWCWAGFLPAWSCRPCRWCGLGRSRLVRPVWCGGWGCGRRLWVGVRVRMGDRLVRGAGTPLVSGRWGGWGWWCPVSCRVWGRGRGGVGCSVGGVRSGWAVRGAGVVCGAGPGVSGGRCGWVGALGAAVRVVW